MEILGVKVDEVNKEQAMQKVVGFLSGGQHTIFTPNPEFVVKAQKDEYFKKVLNSGDLNLCDGMGLELAIRISPLPRWSEEGVAEALTAIDGKPPLPLLGKEGIKRIPGVDFMLDICNLAAEKDKTVYLLGSGSDEVVKKTAENLQTQFPNLKIVGYDKGPELRETCHSRKSGNPVDDCLDSHLHGNDSEDIDKINAAQPDILFVAFGMGKQEKWIYENLSKMPGVKIAMGVGGSFDYISGKIKRAPLFLRRLGLEWMYRLVREPQRFKRIFNATVKFTYLVLKSKFLISNVKSNPND